MIEFSIGNKINFDSLEAVNIFVNEGYFSVGDPVKVEGMDLMFVVVGKKSPTQITIMPKDSVESILRMQKEMDDRDKRKSKSFPNNAFTAFGRSKVSVYEARR